MNMTTRDFYPEMDKVKQMEKAQKSKIQGGKFSKHDNYIAGTSGLPDDEAEARYVTQLIHSNLKDSTDPSSSHSFSERPWDASDEETIIPTHSITEEGIAQSESKNLILPINLEKIRQEVLFPSVSDLVPNKLMTDNIDPMIVTNETPSDEITNDPLALENIQKKLIAESLKIFDKSKGDVKEHENETFKGMNLQVEEKLSKRARKALKRKEDNKPHNAVENSKKSKSLKQNEENVSFEQKNDKDLLEEKIDLTNMEIEDETNENPINQSFEMEIEKETNENPINQSFEMEIEKETNENPINQNSGTEIGKETNENDNKNSGTQIVKETNENENKNSGTQIVKETNENENENNKNSETENVEIIYDDTNIASEIEVVTEISNESNTSLNEPQDAIPIKKTPLIKMEHFYYTQQDCYKRYRDIIGLEIRRRKYMEMSKKQKTLLVENTNGGKNVKHQYEIPTATNGALQNLKSILLKCMVHPCETLNCKASNDFNTLFANIPPIPQTQTAPASSEQIADGTSERISD